MINATQLRMEIIRPVLKQLEPEIPYSIAAENLLMGTCAQESRMGSFVVQVGNGPAQGIFQMEPDTENDIWENYLFYRKELNDKIMYQIGCVNNQHPNLNEMVGNLYYQVAMARVHYYRVPMAMPEEDNVEQMAHYWKIYYNTPDGKGTIEEFVENYNRYVA